jgi:hypothetical protein
MRTIKSPPTILRAAVPAFLLATAVVTQASTIWNGPSIAFFHSQENLLADDLTSGVALTRGSGGGLYNSVTETGPSGGISPKDTQWAVGTLAEYTNNPSSLSFGACPLEAGNHPPSDIGTTFVVHLVNENIYFQLMLTNWGGEGGSGDKTFGYIRSTPAAVVVPPPTVNITSPASGAVFAAPASVNIAANATNSSATVTNVQFFANSASSLGSATAAPFSITANSLAAGAYALTAVATSAGISATSAVVNITVVTPVTVSLAGSAIVASTNFQFSYAANVGLSYVIQVSASLASTNWVSLATNLASSNPMIFVDKRATNQGGYYRVGRLPNP